MHATVVSRIEYAARGAGWYISVQPLTARVSASGLIGYCNDDLPAVADLFSTADDEFFRRVTSRVLSRHLLGGKLPPPKPRNFPPKNFWPALIS